MKKFMMVCAIMAACMLTLGIVLSLAAGAVRGAGAITEVVESVTGGRVRLNFGSGSGPWGILWNNGCNSAVIFDDSHPVQQGDVDRFAISSDVKRMKIDLGNCIFETAVSADDSFYLTAENAGKYQCYEENGVLHLNVGNPNTFILGIGSNTERFTLYIPSGQHFEEVELDLGAGQVTLNNLSADTVSLDVGAGQIIARNIRARELAVDVGAGQVELPGMNVNVLEAEIGMGELLGGGSILERADLECSMGNIEMTLEGSWQDFNYKLDVAAGNLDLGSNSYSGLAQKQNIQNNAAKNMAIECSMGNVTILFEE